MDEKLKRVTDDMKRHNKEKEDKQSKENKEKAETSEKNAKSKEENKKISNTYESLTAQLFNIHTSHSKLISEIRNKNVGVVKQLLEHMEK